MRIKYCAAFLTLFMVVGTAKAQEGEDRERSSSDYDYYFSGAVGFTATNDANLSLDATATTPQFSGDVDIDESVNAAIAFGTNFTDYLRGEVQFSWRTADLDSWTVNSARITLGGDYETLAFFYNMYVDVFPHQAVTPYFGGGIGFAYHDVSLSQVSTGAVSISTNASESDTVFAYQLGGGLSAALNDRVTAFIDYHYLGSSDVSINGGEIEYGAHEGRVGLRFGF
ncbi:MAG: outer membrane beta-barrel protein [Pseudomonadota bacterium]